MGMVHAYAMNIDSIIMTKYNGPVYRHAVLMIFTALMVLLVSAKINHLEVEFNHFRGWRGGPCIRKGFN